MPYATNANNLLLRLGDMSGKEKVPKAAPKADTMMDMIER
jgi:hypothetical protein